MTAKAKTLSVRVSKELYDLSSALARRNKVSYNALISESLRQAVQDDERRQLERFFDMLGEDPELTDVEYAFAAQAEVVLRDEP